MKDHEPTVTSRVLGAGLYAALTAAGMNASEVARMLGWSASRVSRLLSGKRAVSSEDAAGFLAVCGVTGAMRTRLLNLARDWHQLSWWEEHGHCLRARFEVLDALEPNAVTITIYQPMLIPAVLQTADYARALFEADPNVPSTMVDERVTVHRQRQAIIDRRSPPLFRVFLGEHVLTRKGLGSDLMSDQVHHLLRLAVRPNVEIRIVPEPARLLGDWQPFQLFTFKELRSVVCLEHLTSTAFLERGDSVRVYRDVVARLDQRALDGPRSRAWLTNLGESLGPCYAPLSGMRTAAAHSN